MELLHKLIRAHYTLLLLQEFSKRVRQSSANDAKAKLDFSGTGMKDDQVQCCFN
jgi:hypothetical protein